MSNWPIIRNRASCLLSIGCRRLVLSKEKLIFFQLKRNHFMFFFHFLVGLWQQIVLLWKAEVLLDFLEKLKLNFWTRLWSKMPISGPLWLPFHFHYFSTLFGGRSIHSKFLPQCFFFRWNNFKRMRLRLS